MTHKAAVKRLRQLPPRPVIRRVVCSNRWTKWQAEVLLDVRRNIKQGEYNQNNGNKDILGHILKVLVQQNIAQQYGTSYDVGERKRLVEEFREANPTVRLTSLLQSQYVCIRYLSWTIEEAEAVFSCDGHYWHPKFKKRVEAGEDIKKVAQDYLLYIVKTGVII